VETIDVRGRGWRGSRSRRRRVCVSGTLPALRLGHGRLSLRRRLARRLRLLSRGDFGGRRLGGLDVCSGRGGGGTRRQKALRIQVAGFVRSLANAEVYVRLGPFTRPARAEGADLCAFGDGRALDLRDGSEMEEGHREAVGCSNRDRAAAARHRSGKRDAARRRGEHRLSGRPADVDAPMLTRGVRVTPVIEVLQHRPTRRPGPGVRGRRAGQEREEDRQQQPMLAHAASSVVLFVNKCEDSAVRRGCQDRRHEIRRSAPMRVAVRCDPVPVPHEMASLGAPAE
jgi:hypothetical protein